MTTATLTIGAALAQAHRTLLQDLRRLEAAIADGAAMDMVDLRGRLAEARTDVTRHFLLEEESDAMVPLTEPPRLAPAVQKLRDEHRDLRHTLDALITQAATALALDDSLRQSIRAWIRSVRRHERRENDLVQDAFNLDIGADD